MPDNKKPLPAATDQGSDALSEQELNSCESTQVVDAQQELPYFHPDNWPGVEDHRRDMGLSYRGSIGEVWP